MKDHFEIVQFLKNLDINKLRELGGALGLSYQKLKKMDPLCDEMVAAWLNEEDYVPGKPSWERLKTALKKIDQTGLANSITEGTAVHYMHDCNAFRSPQ